MYRPVADPSLIRHEREHDRRDCGRPARGTISRPWQVRARSSPTTSRSKPPLSYRPRAQACSALRSSHPGRGLARADALPLIVDPSHATGRPCRRADCRGEFRSGGSPLRRRAGVGDAGGPRLDAQGQDRRARGRQPGANPAQRTGSDVAASVARLGLPPDAVAGPTPLCDSSL